jgi:transposase
MPDPAANTPELPDDVDALKALAAKLLAERDVLGARLASHETTIASHEAAIAAHETTIVRHETVIAAHETAIAQHEAKVTEHLARVTDLEADLALLQAKYRAMRRRLYGPRADTLETDTAIDQMLLDFAKEMESRPADPEGLPKDAATGTADQRRVGATEDGKQTTKKPRGRRRIGDLNQLPIVEVPPHDLTDAEKACPCCGTCRTHSGTEESWQVEYVPGHFVRLHHIRHTYACKSCEEDGLGPQMETAAKSRETAPIEKGMAGPGLMAYVVTSKYADFLPLHRLENIFSRNGLDIARSTLCVWCRDVAEIAMPLYRLMCDRVRESRVVATDDTIMPMLAKDRTKKARIWIYSGDERNPYNVFDFTPSRSRDGPTHFLTDFCGTLLADGYAGYDGVVAGNGITRAGCWAHARRKFVEAEKSEPKVAAEAVALMDELFAIERRTKDADLPARARARAEESMRVLGMLRDRLLAWKARLLPKHPMSGAAGYTLNQWEQLTAFLNDPEVPIHNDLAEQEMKRQALNRKNSLFVGNERGGRTSAVLSSLTSSCRRHAVDPQVYLTQLLVNLPAIGEDREKLTEWLPDLWKQREAERERAEARGGDR